MSKGGGGNNQVMGLPTFTSQDSSTRIPDWLTNASKYGISQATNLLNRGTTPYGGQIAPGMTLDQKAAGEMFRNGVGAFGGYYDNAANLTNAGVGQGPQIEAQSLRQGLSGISDYMNPYVSNVVDSVSRIGQQNLGTALNQTRDQAVGAKAFGGSRHGVQEGVATAQNNLQTNNLIANLMSQGYQQATGQLGTDIQNNLAAQQANQNAYNAYANRNLSAGQQMAGIGTAARAAQVGDVNNLFQYGSAAQQTQGAQQQAAYQEWLRQQNYPLQALQAYNQTVNAAPHDTNTSTNGWSMGPVQQQGSSSPLMGALGLGMAGLSMLPGGTIPGLLGGITGGALGSSPFPRGNYF